jgi:hypothetical protein
MKARVLSAWVGAAAFPVVLALAAATTVSPALANPPTACGPHPDIIKTLGDRFHETQSATALTSAGTLLEVLTARDGSTWTIIVSRPDGLSCVVAAGQNWQDKGGDQAATSISF